MSYDKIIFMEKNIYYTTNNMLGVCTKSIKKTFDSKYIEKYRENCIAIENKNKWKYSGASAMFQQHNEGDTGINDYCAISSICAYNDDYIYSVTCGDVSAIVNTEIATGEENLLIHTNNLKFYSMEYDSGKKQIVCSTSNDKDYLTRSITVFDLNSNDLRTLTSGDSIDENPSFSKFNEDIFYNSRGIARNSQMLPVNYSNSTIYCINEYGKFDEIILDEKFDYIAPKTDAAGNLYYIKKPYVLLSVNNSNFLVDFLLMPFRLIYGFAKILLFLSNLTKKDKKRNMSKTYGANPVLNKEMSERDLYIYEQNINLEKEEKINKKKGDKNPGFAPQNFELYKRTQSGEETKIKSGVLSFDVDAKGNIVYTNGKYIISLAADGKEEIIHKDKIITSVRFN